MKQSTALADQPLASRGGSTLWTGRKAQCVSLASPWPSSPKGVARRPIGPDGSVADPALEIGDRRIGKSLVRRHFQVIVVITQAPDQQAFFRIARHNRGARVAPFEERFATVDAQIVPRLLSAVALKARGRQDGPDLRSRRRPRALRTARVASPPRRSGQHSAHKHRQRHGESHTARHPKDQSTNSDAMHHNMESRPSKLSGKLLPKSKVQGPRSGDDVRVVKTLDPGSRDWHCTAPAASGVLNAAFGTLGAMPTALRGHVCS